jgi:hypothetical protein
MKVCTGINLRLDYQAAASRPFPVAYVTLRRALYSGALTMWKA